MNKLYQKSANNICVMFAEEYLEDGNASGYCVIQTKINDEIDISDCENMYKELKERGTVRNESFSDNVWTCYYDLYETNLKFDFNIEVSQELILSLKKYVLVKLCLKKNEVTTVQMAFSHIKEMLRETREFDLDRVSDFKKYATKKANILFLSNCKEFLQFCTSPKVCGLCKNEDWAVHRHIGD